MYNLETKKLTQNKRAFALFITLILVSILFLLLYSIVQNNVFQSNLNRLKYMNLQAHIHYDYVKNYIQEHSKDEIEQLSLDDKRFILKIIPKIQEKQTIYYVVIQAWGEIPVRLSKKIIK